MERRSARIIRMLNLPSTSDDMINVTSRKPPKKFVEGKFHIHFNPTLKIRENCQFCCEWFYLHVR